MSDYPRAWTEWEDEEDVRIDVEPMASTAPIAPNLARREAEAAEARRRSRAEYMRVWRARKKAERECERQEVEELRARLIQAETGS